MSDSIALLVGIVFAVVFLLVPLVLWVWALVEIIKYEFTGNNKVIWLLIVIFVPLGQIFYFIIGRKQRLIGNQAIGATGFCTGCGTQLNGAVVCPACHTPQKVAAKGNNGAMVAVIAGVCILAFVFFTGIIAAIAIPQFAAYRTKAYNMAAKSELQNAKATVESYYTANNTYPESLESIGYKAMQPQMVVQLEKQPDGSYVLISYHQQGTKVFATTSQTTDVLSKLKEAPDTDYAVEPTSVAVQQQ